MAWTPFAQRTKVRLAGERAFLRDVGGVEPPSLRIRVVAMFLELAAAGLLLSMLVTVLAIVFPGRTRLPTMTFSPSLAVGFALRAVMVYGYYWTANRLRKKDPRAFAAALVAIVPGVVSALLGRGTFIGIVLSAISIVALLGVRDELDGGQPDDDD